MPEADTSAAQPSPSGFFSRFVMPESYGLVLLLIMVTYAVTVSVHASWGPSVVLTIQVATVWFALRTSNARRVVRLTADGLLVLAIVVAIAAPFVTETPETSAFVLAAGAALYLIAPLSILRDLVFRAHIDGETFLGAIAAYLLIGMFFAFTYRIFAIAQPDAFFGAQGDGTAAQTLFFSFTTLTTTGYGNLVPAGNPGQSMAVFEMLLGQLFLATAVAKVITAWRPKRRSQTAQETAED